MIQVPVPAHPRRALAALVRATVAAALLAALLPLGPALPAEAQMRPGGPGDQPTQIIDLKARVRYGNKVVDYRIHPAEHVKLTVGDRVQVSLVGTAIVDGRGVEADIPATFRIASGPWRIDLAPAGRNSVTVVATQPNSVHRGNPDSRSSLSYEVQGRYDMKPALRDGRITFDIAGGQQAPPVTAPEDDRWEMAEDIAADLAQIRLDEREILDEYWVERIYLEGYSGVRTAAVALAAQTERSGAMRGWSAEEIVARLYRALLHREGTTAQLRQADPAGFDANVRRVRTEGYESLVRTFVESQEFRNEQRIDRLERLTRGYQTPRFRSPGDTRPSPRDTRPY